MKISSILSHWNKRTLLPVALFTILFAACEPSANGDLDGLWMMTKMDSIQSGKSQNMRPMRISWSFQKNLYQAFCYETDAQDVAIMGRFQHANGQLTLSDFFRYNRMEGDVMFTQDSLPLLRPYGFSNIPDTFTVEKLNKNKMQVSNRMLRLYFDKY